MKKNFRINKKRARCKDSAHFRANEDTMQVIRNFNSSEQHFVSLD